MKINDNPTLITNRHCCHRYYSLLKRAHRVIRDGREIEESVKNTGYSLKSSSFGPGHVSLMSNLTASTNFYCLRDCLCEFVIFTKS